MIRIRFRVYILGFKALGKDCRILYSGNQGMILRIIQASVLKLRGSGRIFMFASGEVAACSDILRILVAEALVYV